MNNEQTNNKDKNQSEVAQSQNATSESFGGEVKSIGKHEAASVKPSNSEFPPPSVDAVPIPAPAPLQGDSGFPQPTMPPQETQKIPQPAMPPQSQQPTFQGSTKKESQFKAGISGAATKIKNMPIKTKIIASGGLLAAIVVIVAILFATHVLCFHDWEEATCYEPKTCTICGQTEGDPLGHYVEEWTTDVEPTCSKTGSEHGNCVRCGLEINREIPLAEHTPGEWKVTEEYTITSTGTVVPGTQTQYCSVCGAEMDTKSYTIELTMSQENALQKAASYLDTMSFSYSGLIDQLEFEGYSTEDATFAVDHCGADWNEQAAKKAQDYLDFMSFSRSGLIDQLMFEGFTREQAEYGVAAVGY